MHKELNVMRGKFMEDKLTTSKSYRLQQAIPSNAAEPQPVSLLHDLVQRGNVLQTRHSLRFNKDNACFPVILNKDEYEGENTYTVKY